MCVKYVQVCVTSSGYSFHVALIFCKQQAIVFNVPEVELALI